jgi:hypothetical protein
MSGAGRCKVEVVEGPWFRVSMADDTQHRRTLASKAGGFYTVITSGQVGGFLRAVGGNREKAERCGTLQREDDATNTVDAYGGGRGVHLGCIALDVKDADGWAEGSKGFDAGRGLVATLDICG